MKEKAKVTQEWAEAFDKDINSAMALCSIKETLKNISGNEPSVLRLKEINDAMLKEKLDSISDMFEIAK